MNKKLLYLLIGLGGIAGTAYLVKAKESTPTKPPTQPPTQQPSPPPQQPPSPPPQQPPSSGGKTIVGYYDLYVENLSSGYGRKVSYEVHIVWEGKPPFTENHTIKYSGTLDPYGSNSYAYYHIPVYSDWSLPFQVAVESSDCIRIMGNGPPESYYGGAPPNQVCRCGKVSWFARPGYTSRAEITPKEEAKELYNYVWNCG